MNHYKKYIKYKQKYLNLLLQIGGNQYIVTKECNKEKFIDFVKSNGENIENNYYFVILNIVNIKYNCIVELDDEDDENIIIRFISNNIDISDKSQIIEKLGDISFIKISFDRLDDITTRLEFEKMNGKNKLDTIMEILEYMYIHLCKDIINLTDVAIFTCDANQEYDAIIYRILGTDKEITNLSIYNKYKYKSDCNHEIENLEYIRNFTIIDFIHLLKINMDELTKLKYLNKDTVDRLICELNDNQDKTVHEFYKNIAHMMVDMEKCINYFMYFNMIKFLSRSRMVDHKNFIRKINEIKRCVNSISKNLLF